MPDPWQMAAIPPTCLDDRRLASVDREHHLRIWNVGSGREEARWDDDRRDLGGVDFTPDDTRIIATGGTGVRYCDAATGQPIAHVETIKTAFGFLPDKTLLAVLNAAGDPLVAWDCSKNAYRTIWETTPGLPVAVSPDGKWLALLDHDTFARGRRTNFDRIRVIEAASRREILNTPFAGSSDRVFSTKGDRFVVLDTCAKLWAWRVAGLQQGPRDMRTWTDREGKRTAQAALLDASRGEVRLRKPDGATVTVPISGLSPADQAFVRRQMGAAATVGPFESKPPAKTEEVKGFGQLIDPDGDCPARMEDYKLVVTVPQTTHDLNAEKKRFNAPRIVQEVEGDFLVEVSVEGTFDLKAGQGKESPYQGAGLVLMEDERNYVRLERAVTAGAGDETPGVFISYEICQDGVSNGRGQFFPDPKATSSLRLERRGRILAARVSRDGAGWISLPNQLLDMSAKLKVGVVAVNFVRIGGFCVTNPKAARSQPGLGDRTARDLGACTVIGGAETAERWHRDAARGQVLVGQDKTRMTEKVALDAAAGRTWCQKRAGRDSHSDSSGNEALWGNRSSPIIHGDPRPTGRDRCLFSHPQANPSRRCTSMRLARTFTRCGLPLLVVFCLSMEPSQSAFPRAKTPEKERPQQRLLPKDEAAKRVLTKLPDKLGTNVMESTPLLYKGRRLMFHSRRVDVPKPDLNQMYLFIVDQETGKEVTRFGNRHSLGSAFVRGDEVHVFAAYHTDNDWFHDLYHFCSMDLKTWTREPAIRREGSEHLLNSSVCEDEQGFLMAYESNQPVAFCFKFARSRDLATWQKLPGLVFTGEKKEYSACPVMRYIKPYYYVIYLHAAVPGHKGWVSFLARSKDLATWQLSPRNPILEASEGEGCNNSDVDLIEIGGKTYVYYCTGDQQTWGDLKCAVFPGPMREFFESYFPAGVQTIAVSAKK